MTRNEAKQLLPIITAFAEGKTIQSFNDETQKWFTVESPDFLTDDYRIKPKPREF